MLIDAVNFATIESEFIEVVREFEKVPNDDKALMSPELINRMYDWGVENGKPNDAVLVASIREILTNTKPLLEQPEQPVMPVGSEALSEVELDRWIDENPAQWFAYVQEIENQGESVDIGSWLKVSGLLDGEQQLDEYMMKYAQQSDSPLEVMSILESALREHSVSNTEYSISTLNKYSESAILKDKLVYYETLEDLTPENKGRAEELIIRLFSKSP